MFVPAGTPHAVRNEQHSTALSANFVDASNYAQWRRAVSDAQGGEDEDSGGGGGEGVHRGGAEKEGQEGAGAGGAAAGAGAGVGAGSCYSSWGSARLRHQLRVVPEPLSFARRWQRRDGDDDVDAVGLAPGAGSVAYPPVCGA
jgi:hypothetical protein